MSKTRLFTIYAFRRLPIFGLAFLMMLAFKLGGWTDLSWLWITCPLWIIPTLLLAALVIVGVGVGFFYLFCCAYDWNTRRKRRKARKS